MSEPLVRLQLIVPESFKRRLKAAAAMSGRTMADELVLGWTDYEPDRKLVRELVRLRETGVSPVMSQEQIRTVARELGLRTEQTVTALASTEPSSPEGGAHTGVFLDSDEPLPHERNAEIRQEPFLSAFIARSHEVDSSGLCVSWCSACRQSAEAERKADYDKAVRLANERKAIKEPGGRDTTEKIKRLRDGLATLRHSTREDGTCPHWCVRCSAEHELRQLGEFE